MSDDRNYPIEPERRKPVRKPPSSPPASSYDKHGARYLDPATAVRLPQQEVPKSTVYVGDQLLLRQTADNGAVDFLRAIAQSKNLRVTVNEADERLVALARRARIPENEVQPLLSRIELRIDRDAQSVVAPPDAWTVLQQFRAALRLPARGDGDNISSAPTLATPNEDGSGEVAPDKLEVGGLKAGSTEALAAALPDEASRLDISRQIHLDHLLSATTIEGVPLTSGHSVDGVPLTSGHALPSQAEEFAIPGHGGRGPVAWTGKPPHRLEDGDKDLPCTRRPVVAILDTGVGPHPWLPEPIVTVPALDGVPIGITDPASDPNNTGGRTNLLVGDLDSDAGHGTFIAGLIRQTCPDANIVSIRIMGGDGVVSEGNLIDSLNQLWLRQKLAIQENDPSQVVDVVSLSLGYYHENADDVQFDPLLLTPLHALGRLGVAVIVSSGNDATLRPMYPAAFAPYPGSPVPPEPNAVPITAVGALNPGGTVAMFSNEGPWVTCHRPGSALVSTMPTNFDASGQPTAEVEWHDTIRETLDPDDFRSGFGTWSGTSFSAPILAGEVVQTLLNQRRAAPDDPDTDIDSLDPAIARARMSKALHTAKRATEPAS